MTFLDSNINHTRKVSTGVIVAIYDIRSYKIPTLTAYGKPSKWHARCLDHDFGQNFHSKDAAWTDSRDSANICPECARIAAKEGRWIQPTKFLSVRPSVPAPSPTPAPEPTPTRLPRTPETIRQIAQDLMVANGVSNVPVKMNSRLTRALGHVKYRWDYSTGQRKAVPTVLALSSKRLPSLPWEEIRDTILHEIAHVIAGHEAGHGPKWKAVCVQIGAKPERFYRGDAIQAEDHKYQATCESCGTKVGFDRMTRGWRLGAKYHKNCGGRFITGRR